MHPGPGADGPVAWNQLLWRATIGILPAYKHVRDILDIQLHLADVKDHTVVLYLLPL